MKTLNQSAPNNILSKAIRTLSETLGIKPMAFKVVPLRMYRVTRYDCPISGLAADLKEYFIDEDGDLYSRNTRTYFTKYGRLLEKLSNNCPNSKGDYINSLRTTNGLKVTVRRSVLVNMMKLGRFEDVTDSKLETLVKGA